MGIIEITMNFPKLQNISSIEHIVIYLLSSVSLQLQRITIILYCEENVP